ncbi:hypothetical protein BH10BDE1_BH10BDE1_18840 [soil metagenome]
MGSQQTVASSVASSLALYKKSVFEKNVEDFVSIYAPNLMVYDAWDKWSIEGLPAWREMATEWLGSLGDERVVVDFDNLRETTQDRMAFATAIVRYTAVDASGAKLRSLENRHTWVFERTKAGWQIVHQHSSAPASGETMKISLSRLSN